MKRYIELETGAAATHLKIETYYSLGGYNCFTYRQEERGYYLSVTPVSRKTTDYGVTLESYTAFSGIKRIIKTVSRQSKKAAAQADENAVNYVHDLVLYVCHKNALPIPAEFITPCGEA